MSKQHISLSPAWQKSIVIFLLSLASILCIVLFLPRDAKQQFHYDIGKPWMYPSFIANFDFPIYKTDEAIQAERDSLLNLFYPYYNHHTDVESQQVAKLKKKFKQGIPGLPQAYFQILLDRMHRLYQAGIMDTPEYNAEVKDSTYLIRAVSAKEAQSLQINCIYSTLTAYEALLSDNHLLPYKQLLQRCNLNEYIVPNLVYDKQRSETERNNILSSIPIASGMVMSGQKVIDRGEIVNDDIYRVLNSYKREIMRQNASIDQIKNLTIGQFIYVSILILFFTTYLVLFRSDYFSNSRSITMLYMLVTLFPILVSLLMKHHLFSVYIIPITMAAMFVRMFMDPRTACMTHLTIVLLCTAAVKYQYEFIIIQLIGGLVAIYSLRELSQRAQLFKTALFVGTTYAATYFALQMMQNNWFDTLDKTMYYHFIINSILLLLSYPLMFLIEKIFGFTSNVTFFELSNTNRGLLRNLSEIAPGTFQHSITVGNLASEIANKIGANSLLVRTGALYHDIGKMTNPVFFTENQMGIDPHKDLSYKESARIIISHVTEGVKIAEQNNLPQFIKDFILTHHGAGVVKYFYIKYKNEHPDEEIDIEPFTYPGPNPFTREQAILMMADSVEAASRSLPEYTEETISNLTNDIIDQQMAMGVFTNCPITFRDVTLSKQILIEKLKAIYHTRISYPKEINAQ